MLRIGLIVTLSPGYPEGVVRGVGMRTRPDRDWLFELVKPTPAAVARVCREGIDGAIAVSMTRALGRMLVSAGIPVVNTGPRDFAPSLPHVGNDDMAIGALAARHLLDRGFTQLAYVGCATPGGDYAARRHEGFTTAAAQAGRAVTEFPDFRSARHLERWLARLPQPAGVMAASDVVAWQVVESCRRLGLHVPEQMAVVGVDDDQALCHLAYPSLSSVRVASHQIGMRAADMLAAMLARPALRPPRAEIPPLGVAARQSTDIFAIADPVVAEALRWIGRHATTPVNVAAVAAHVDVSRRSLEQRFRRHLGRSPREEIERVRLVRARELLVDSTFPLSHVARLAGFSDSKRFSTVFRQAFGTPPSALRRAASSARPTPIAYR